MQGKHGGIGAGALRTWNHVDGARIVNRTTFLVDFIDLKA